MSEKTIIDELVIKQTAKLVKKMARTLRRAEAVTAADLSAYGKLVESYSKFIGVLDKQDDQETVFVDRIIIEQTEHLLKTTGRKIRESGNITAGEVSALSRLMDVYERLIALQKQQEQKGKVNYYDWMCSENYMTKAQMKKAGIEAPQFGG